MVLLIPTPLPQVPRYDLEERQLGGILTALSSALDGGSGSSGGGDTGSSGSGNSDGGNTGGTTSDSGGSTGDTTVATQPTTTSPTSTAIAGTTSSTAVGTTSAATTAAQSTARSGDTSAAGTGTADGGNVVTEYSTNGGSTVIVRTTTASTATAAADSSHSSSSSNGGLIGGVVGGVVGGLALLTALIVLLIVWRRRRSRTGHGWFLCFGTRPKRGNKDFDVDWPTFDPTSGAAGVGGTLGSRSGRGRNQGQGGTLPEVDDDLHQDQYSNEDDMREIGSGGGGSYSNYYGAPTSQHGYSSGPHTNGPHSVSYNGPSDEGHFRSGGWATMPMGAAAGAANTSPTGGDSVPTYDHLDPPEVREARAREQAEAQAQAMAAYQPNSPTMSQPQLQQQQHSPGYYPASSPPMPSQRPLSDHRLSTGTTQALAANQYFDNAQDLDSGTVQTDRQRMLHLHNPDA